jgi:hypothetical protein
MGGKYAKPVRSRQACMRISFYKMEIKNWRIGDPEENIIWKSVHNTGPTLMIVIHSLYHCALAPFDIQLTASWPQTRWHKMDLQKKKNCNCGM